ncbi:hemolysin-III related-domain-containing protein [Exophiala viscosa]|uniref:Hemolysin-III related-domain-containing protein n=1 Tax=Exophiala viscosa TaxID=2486360 RepID=A0AAN6E050_9EURO|nr:hemolysin-III related-domain-containing protein [Exophiala viscosa]
MSDPNEQDPGASQQPVAASVADKSTQLWYTLVHWNDLPHWQQDNHHIHGGYRQASYSYARSLQSILHWHNESVNIWTHLVPATLSLPCGIMLYKTLEPRYERATAADVLAMGCFFVGAAVCLSMSATFHAVSNHSPSVARMWNQFDYAGISVLIAGSFIPSVYYGFWCNPQRQWTYWTMVSKSLSVLPRFRTPAWRPYRALMFVGMGISAVFPVLDGLMTFGLSAMEKQIGLSWLVLQGALYILGAGLYAARIPEAWYPGKFDTLGSSHQIFHVLIVLAAMSQLKGLLKAFDYRHGFMGSLCL